MPKATTLNRRHHPAAPERSSDRIEEALSVVGRASNQVRLHERLLQAAGVRLDRGGASLLHKLHLHKEPLRVTALADLLGIDAPTVTRKVQQLERDGLVSRHPDPDDGRATRIQLTPAGRRTFERVLKARESLARRSAEGLGRPRPGGLRAAPSSVLGRPLARDGRCPWQLT